MVVFEAIGVPGIVDVAPLVTGEVGLDGLPGAFAGLADPREYCTVLVVP